MSTPFIINSGFSGLGATGASAGQVALEAEWAALGPYKAPPVMPTVRMPNGQVTRDEWVQNTNEAWLAANPNAAKALQGDLSLTSALTVGGGITALVGVWLLGTGKAKTGVFVTMAGVGLGVVGIMKGRKAITPYMDDGGVAVGSQPGLKTW